MKNTPNYNLPQYEGTDKFTKEVLNDAFTKVDTAINDLQETFNINGTGSAIITQEVVNARNGKQNLKERIDEISSIVDTNTSQLEAIETNPAFKTTTNSAQLGLELIDSSGWTTIGWTGDFTTGFKNTTGQTQPLKKNMGATGTKLYQVSFRVESPTPAGVPNASTDFEVTLGGSSPFVTYQGGGNYNYNFGIQSVVDGDLCFIPGVTFDGTIKNISVKEIIGDIPNALEFKDVNNKNSFVAKATFEGLRSLYIGNSSTGCKNTTGENNVAIGAESMKLNTTGYWNTAIGVQSLSYNTTGSRNVALGRYALEQNISGDRNIAIGTFTLMRNTHGRQNIALGADALWVNTTGSRNICLGMGAMGENTTGNENIAIGYIALDHNTTGNNNIAIGYDSMSRSNGNENVAIGKQSLKNAISNQNVSIGYLAMLNTTTGNNNVGVGMNALLNNKTGRECVAIGANASANSNQEETTVVGAWAGQSCTGGKNTFLGHSAGRQITTGVNNICIGRNTFLAGANATDSNKYNIGNTLYGDLIAKNLGVGVNDPKATLHLKGSNGGQGSAPIKFTQGSLLGTKEVGAFETDGNKLYFTQLDGTRKELAFV